MTRRRLLAFALCLASTLSIGAAWGYLHLLMCGNTHLDANTWFEMAGWPLFARGSPPFHPTSLVDVQETIVNIIVLVALVTVTAYSIWRRILRSRAAWQWTIIDLMRWTLVVAILLSIRQWWTLDVEIVWFRSGLGLTPGAWAILRPENWFYEHPPWLVRLPLLLAMAACVNLVLRLAGVLILAITGRLFARQGVTTNE